MHDCTHQGRRRYAWPALAQRPPQVQVVLQVLRTALYTQLPGYEALVRSVVDAHPDNEAVAGTARGYFARIEREREEAAKRAAIAAESGYSDQAHLVREFVEFAGEPPTAWARRLAMTDSRLAHSGDLLADR